MKNFGKSRKLVMKKSNDIILFEILFGALIYSLNENAVNNDRDFKESQLTLKQLLLVPKLSIICMKLFNLVLQQLELCMKNFPNMSLVILELADEHMHRAKTGEDLS